RYFTRMAEAVMAHRGMIAEFTGDGIVALFGAPTTYPDDALRAVACSVAMQQELHRFNLAEHKELEMGIGIATGMVVAGNIGSEKRMKYGVVGEAINLAARLESFTVGSQVLIGEATYLEVADQVQVGEQLELRAKGKREPVRCYSLQGVFGPFCLQLPEKQQEIGVSLELPALCFRITGKQVEVEPLPATATLLTRHTLWLRTGWPVEPLGNLKLHLELGDGRIADDIYGKVTSVESPSGTGESAGEAGAAYRVELRFTSLPEREREMLLGMLEQA
ncbi:MAG: adenylate/guanylate cyclase domain-containing protein, partial [Deltaproteobacteria bacterium]|nr:adenylate/guanylate cyclase domain-containing protein [Deltaproteobacteria bacterium]